MLPWAWDTLYLFRNVVPTGFHLSQRCWQNYKYDNFLADSKLQNAFLSQIITSFVLTNKNESRTT